MVLSLLLASGVGVGSFLASSGDKKIDPPKPVQVYQEDVRECPKPYPYLSFDYLFWKAEEDGVIFGLNVPKGLPTGNNVSGNYNAKYLQQHFDFTSGFRLGVGYDLPYKKYDLFLNWTRLHPDNKRHVSESSPTIIAQLFVGITDDEVLAQQATSKWHLNFDMLDLELGKKYMVGKRLSIRPHVGLKGGWINQKQKVKYEELEGTNVDEPAPLAASAKIKNHYKGVGPRVGLDLRYGIGSQFGIFGNVSGALLYGHFNVKTDLFLETQVRNPSVSQPVNDIDMTLPNSRNRLCPTVQLLLGGDWCRCLYNKWWIRFGAAYEVQYWWDQWRPVYSVDSMLLAPSAWSGDLTFHGLTLQARFDF